MDVTLTQWIDAAIVDLNFDLSNDSSARTGYVALSRVRRGDDILTVQPFPLVTDMHN